MSTGVPTDDDDKLSYDYIDAAKGRHSQSVEYATIKSDHDVSKTSSTQLHTTDTVPSDDIPTDTNVCYGTARTHPADQSQTNINGD